MLVIHFLKLRIFVFAAFFISLGSAFASQVTFQSLDQLIEEKRLNKDTFVFAAVVKKFSRKETASAYIYNYSVESAEVLQGKITGAIKELEFSEVIPIMRDKNGKIVGHFSLSVPYSGIEGHTQEGEMYIFFSDAFLSNDPVLRVFRIESLKDRDMILKKLKLLKR